MRRARNERADYPRDVKPVIPAKAGIQLIEMSPAKRDNNDVANAEAALADSRNPISEIT